MVVGLWQWILVCFVVECGSMGMFFMFKICVNGEREISVFDLFFLYFCAIFCFRRRET